MMKILALFLTTSLLFSCTRHEVNEYEINNVFINQNGHQKKNLKSDNQFISIMYSDLYETSISYNKLDKLQRLQESFGDKNVVIERIAQNMLSDPLAKIPADSIMTNDLDKFITQTYNRFYTRNPSEAETWYVNNLITTNSKLTVREIYYGFLTSEEYKYY